MIKNSQISTSSTVILGPIGQGKQVSSVQMFFCNTNLSTDIMVNIYVVPESQSVPDDTNIILKQFMIPRGDTLEFTQERIILGAGDRVIQNATLSGITQTVSYIEL